ncbi:tetraacyldisaccharide 4'-kinase [Tenacibaculum sp. SG-28]|uniref:tetraacyldisaccharide 4'-kinase n=1 Tax=Tenacibaculum sp. SG-28 TaxID=754426 RepID=UPI000CF479B6|nr:tetraacyldisaccharide 4'-kinase [Tenacibaculum sp. SG-28]PQJ20650.1 tetraacyldisaccharide 4'-kinase [Tenacibaculum sp. SG-28]
MKLLRFLLFPISIVYNLITSIRNFLYDTNMLKQSVFNIPVIAVGNLSVGGTGKSPQIEYLIRLLYKQYAIAVLSRGYKRKLKGFQLVNAEHSAEEVGDEPMQFFRKFSNNVTIAVDADRVHGISSLLHFTSKPELILLDDAFQHRKVKASFYILLTKYNDLYTNDFLLPTGNLRERRAGAKRADVIVVTKCPADLNAEKQRLIAKTLQIENTQKLFFSTITYQEDLIGPESKTLSDFTNKKILLVTGIANPIPLVQYLEKRNISVEHIAFPDHHNFTHKDIVLLQKHEGILKETNSIILTTEKDYVRLESKLTNLYYVSIQTEFIDNKDGFDTCVLEHLQTF